MGDAEIRKQFEEQYSIFLTDAPLFATGFPVSDMEKWKSAVLRDLTSISRTRVGALLLRSIHHYGQIVWITPIDPGFGCQSRTNQLDADLQLDAKIEYTPMVHGAGTACSKQSLTWGGYTNLSFESLFHELVHAFRYVSGKNKKDVVPGKGLAFYGNKEEFIAVLVQGIFASELKRPVRSSHEMHAEIEPERNGSYKFYRSGSETYKYVKEFCMENPGFTKALACIDVAFNPIKAYYDKPGLAKSISLNSPLAGFRDFVNGNVYTIWEFAKEVVQQTLDDERVKKANAGKPPTATNVRTPRYDPSTGKLLGWYDPVTGTIQP